MSSSTSSTPPTPASSDAYVVEPPRFDLVNGPREQYRAMAAFAASVRLDPRLHRLIEIRVSQLNGCAFCLDKHVREARALGESDQRLATLAGWRESPFFTARERAALRLAEAITRIDDQPAVVAAYEAAAELFAPDELAQVVFAATVINSWNRLAIAAGLVTAAR